MPFWEDQNHGLIVHFMKSVLCEFTLIAWGLRAFVTVSCVCAAHLIYCWLFQANTFYIHSLPTALASSLPHWSGGIPS